MIVFVLRSKKEGSDAENTSNKQIKNTMHELSMETAAKAREKMVNSVEDAVEESSDEEGNNRKTKGKEKRKSKTTNANKRGTREVSYFNHIVHPHGLF